MKKWTSIFIAMTLMIILIGCSNGKVEESKMEPKLLKVLVNWDEDNFYRDYASYFTIQNQNIEFEVITLEQLREKRYDAYDTDEEFDFDKEFKLFVEEHQPDVFMVDDNEYYTLAEENRLYDLSILIEQSEFDIENMDTNVIQYLTKKGNGTLYGLASEFYSNALYYNKDLFAEYNVPLPTDQMSWDDIIERAAMFPSTDDEDAIYGFEKAWGDLFGLISGMAETYGLSYVDPDAMEVTMDTEAWNKVFETAINAYQSGAVYLPDEKTEEENEATGDIYYESQEKFTLGKSAMIISGVWYMDYIDNSGYSDSDPINYDIVTVPVDPMHPEKGGSMNISNVFAINAQSEHIDAAWEFIQFVNGDTLAKATGKSTYELLTRKEHMDAPNHINIDAFYKLAPLDDTLYDSYDKLPSTFLSEFESILTEEIASIQKNEKTIEEALQSIQSRADEAMQKAIAEKDDLS
ncbi:extracellular solute-binding protein [Longirhabdus pacifica]|uniref:extracellular solute-binding protein n=1 Tax=Longirhabdus pacifica TaxID=2305227 RepID=UPI001008FE56|nr:extracellular solute-binding protein [Longirhabdus pacifica]